MFTDRIGRHEVIRQGYTWRLFWRRLTICDHILVTFQATLNLSAYFINHCLAVLCKFLGEFWAFWERDISSQSWGDWGKYEMLKIWWIWKIKIEDVYQTVPYQPIGLSFGVVNCLVVFPTQFTQQFPFNNTLNFTPIHVYPRLIKYLPINHKNCNFWEMKNSQVTKERENLH